jgi:hypothetical protein
MPARRGRVEGAGGLVWARPCAPPKDTDNRAFTGETCQAEAVPPDTLREILLHGRTRKKLVKLLTNVKE